MKKEEFHERLMDLQKIDSNHISVNINDVVKICEEYLCTQRVPVPNFVMEQFDNNLVPHYHIEESKNIPHVLKCAFRDNAKQSVFLDWVRKNPDKYVKAMMFGFELENEKLYYVLDRGNESMLIKVFGDVKKSAGIKLDGTFSTIPYMFTEKEIKNYDPRYWQFAVEVAE